MSNPPAPAIRFCVLGTVEITGPAGVERLHAQPSLLTLLAYLVLAPRRAFLSRDRIVGVFWPEHTEERARSALRSALHGLRESLGAGAVVRRGGDVGIDPALLSCDAYDFMSAIRDGELARALELYRGPLLEDLYPPTAGLQHWLDEERENYRAAAGDAAWSLAERYESSAADLTSAARWARKAAKLARHDERRIRRIMLLLDRAGDTAGAIAVFEDFARLLDRDLDVRPSGETEELALTLRRRRDPARSR